MAGKSGNQEEDGVRISRRGFFGLVAGAVAAPFLPRQVPNWRTDSAVVFSKPSPEQAARMDRLSTPVRLFTARMTGAHGLAYWQTVLSDGVYLGISRSKVRHGQQQQS